LRVLRFIATVRDGRREISRPGHGVSGALGWTVYVLKCKTGELYTGCTTDLERRVREHNSGTGSRFTRSRLPVAVVYKEEVGSRSEALRRELAIKAMRRREKLRLVGHAALATSEKTGLSAL
jgi:putative endonuclease